MFLFKIVSLQKGGSLRKRRFSSKSFPSKRVISCVKRDCFLHKGVRFPPNWAFPSKGAFLTNKAILCRTGVFVSLQKGVYLQQGDSLKNRRFLFKRVFPPEGQFPPQGGFPSRRRRGHFPLGRGISIRNGAIPSKWGHFRDLFSPDASFPTQHRVTFGGRGGTGV